MQPVHSITYAGRTQSLADWARERGMSYQTLYKRLLSGWSIASALTMPSTRIADDYERDAEEYLKSKIDWSNLPLAPLPDDAQFFPALKRKMRGPK